MINIKMIKKTGLLLLISTSLFSCNGSNHRFHQFADQNAVSAVGVNFDTRDLVVFNSTTGREVQPCVMLRSTEQNYPSLHEKKNKESRGTKNGLQKCTTELIIDEGLKSAVELSKKPILGEILKNGKRIPATYIVTVKALYNGSICNTDSSGGDQYETCGRRRSR